MFSNDRQKEENLQTEVNIPKKGRKSQKNNHPFLRFLPCLWRSCCLSLVPSVEIAIKPNVLKDKIDISVQASADIDSDGVSKVSLRKIENRRIFF